MARQSGIDDDDGCDMLHVEIKIHLVTIFLQLHDITYKDIYEILSDRNIVNLQYKLSLQLK